jgi:2,4-dienoyl-CoA reductase-like NADH-dependent reductase (Old Yellow Enzyme family)
VKLDHLFSPGRIGTLGTRNRIVMAPMGSNLCEPDGTPSERMLAYYEARARGGAGLVIVEVAAIAWPAGAANPNQLGISHDGFIPYLEKITERIHAHDAAAALQLQHAGKVATRDIAAGRPMWVPSVPRPSATDLFADLTHEDRDFALRDYFQPGAGAEYHEMTHDDIAQLRRWFAEAVVRAKAARFDGVELHAGHGYVLSAFLSPHSNQRDDEYGGELEHRARLLVETVREVRDAVGPDFPLWCRLDGAELGVDDGIRIEDACTTARMAIDAGLDAVHVSAYADPGSGAAFTRAPLVHEPGGFVDLARAVKAAVGPAPVIAVGRIEPDVGDALIAAGDADFITMGRKLLADPDLPNKLLHQHDDDVRPCIYAYRCVGNIFLTKGERCTANPSTGREHELPHELVAADEVRRVVVVGGGPAGMETARIAAARGHHVTLYERASQLGGRARLAALIDPPIGQLLAWLERQLVKLGVDVQVGVEAPVDLAFDDVVDATGATTPLDDSRVRELLEGNDGGDGVVAVFGGNEPAALVAAALAQRGRRVSLLSPHDNFGVGLSPPRLWRTMAALREHGAELVTNATAPAGAVLFDPWEPTAARGSFTHRVGDCREVTFLDGAMLDAARVGRSL